VNAKRKPSTQVVPEPPPTPPEAPRQVLLREAYDITSADRNKAYGDPEDNFANIAEYWNTYFRQAKGIDLELTPQDVAHIMILMKMARLGPNPKHRDSLVDIAGYAACAEDCRVAAE